MKCKTVFENLDFYLDDELEPAVQERIRHHLSECRKCKNLVFRERELREALRHLPYPAPDPEFADQVFSRAIGKAKRQSRSYSQWIRLAASILLVVAIGYITKANWRSSQINMTQVSVQMNLKEEIRLVFNSKENLDEVTFSLEIPNNIELAGYGDKREILWQGDLVKGTNLLVLPVIVRDSEGGLIVAGIRHGQNRRQFNLQLIVRQSGDGVQPLENVNIHKMSVMPI